VWFQTKIAPNNLDEPKFSGYLSKFRVCRNVSNGNNFKALHLSDYINKILLTQYWAGTGFYRCLRSVNITFLSIADPIKYREAFDTVQVEKMLSAEGALSFIYAELLILRHSFL